MQYARVLLLPTVCCVPPMHQTIVPGRFSAMVCAASLTCSGGTPVTSSTTSGVHLATSARISSMPKTRWRDVLLVFPAVLEDVPEHAPDQRHVGARADPDVLVGVGRRAREARVDDDQLAAVLLAAQHVLHRDRMGLGGVAADEEHRLAQVHVVVGIGHRAVAPGVRDTRHRGRVADARLVVDVVGAPQRGELAVQVRLLVRELRRAEPVDRIGAVLLADLEHLVADLVDRLVPGDALPLAARQLHRVLEALVAVAVLAHRRALGAMGAEVEGRVEIGLLAGPDAVLHLGDDAAAHRTVRAHRPLDDGLAVGGFAGSSVGALHHAHGQGRGDGRAPGGEPGSAQEGATVDGATEQSACRRRGLACFEGLLLDQLHRRVSRLES